MHNGQLIYFTEENTIMAGTSTCWELYKKTNFFKIRNYPYVVEADKLLTLLGEHTTGVVDWFI